MRNAERNSLQKIRNDILDARNHGMKGRDCEKIRRISLKNKAAYFWIP
jgi:hypothetical protein